MLKPGNRAASCGRSLVPVPTHTRVLHNKHHASDVLAKTPTKVHAVALFGCSADCLGRAHQPRSVVQSVHGQVEPTGLPCGPPRPASYPTSTMPCRMPDFPGRSLPPGWVSYFPVTGHLRMHRTSGH